MNFVELNRCFVPVGKDQEPVLNLGTWGRKYGGWLEWKELRERRRVILLAEASSGKSAEFRNQQEKLSAEGMPAFFMRIEELADQGFEAALEPGSAKTFVDWRDGGGEAWFFLDSIDEARLNRKSFETSLKKFARELGRSVERARIFVSCRVTDWKGREDRELVERLLPAWESPKQKEVKGNPLLDPIFNKQKETEVRPSKKVQLKPNDLLVVQLVPLSNEQCSSLAEARRQDLGDFGKAFS
jgi:hypothetical protein